MVRLGTLNVLKEAQKGLGKVQRDAEMHRLMSSDCLCLVNLRVAYAGRVRSCTNSWVAPGYMLCPCLWLWTG